MTPNFQAGFKFLLGDEGRKYTNDPDDAGGPTKFGITKKAFEAYWKRPAIDIEIENMSETTAMTIYYYDYWKPLNLDAITDAAIASAIFDCGVLFGIKNSAIMAQKSLRTLGRTLDVDGRVGEVTVQYLNNVSAILFMPTFRGQVLARIEAIILATPQDQKYHNGWTNRANRLLSLVPNQTPGAQT